MKYDLKKIMEMAWKLKKLNSANLFSECLKEAWVAAKTTTLDVKSWFMSKNFSNDEIFIAGCSEKSIVKSTEKALYVEFDSDYGRIYKWVPKTCFVTGMEVLEEKIAYEKQCEGLEKYEKLIAWATERGLKVGNHPKKVNLIAKIVKHGLEVPAWA